MENPPIFKNGVYHLFHSISIRAIEKPWQTVSHNQGKIEKPWQTVSHNQRVNMGKQSKWLFSNAQTTPDDGGSTFSTESPLRGTIQEDHAGEHLAKWDGSCIKNPPKSIKKS